MSLVCCGPAFISCFFFFIRHCSYRTTLTQLIDRYLSDSSYHLALALACERASLSCHFISIFLFCILSRLFVWLFFRLFLPLFGFLLFDFLLVPCVVVDSVQLVQRSNTNPIEPNPFAKLRRGSLNTISLLPHSNSADPTHDHNHGHDHPIQSVAAILALVSRRSGELAVF
ncbi:hypothetical protein B0H34DRAFT_112739 [Crassisporium funariophilum]|nr:hypothetical protein B0H34DRAFT_112739 [Crassisporium funariophilum]